MSKNIDTRIKVCCRMRPINKVEQEVGGQTCVTFSDTTIKLYIAEEQYSHEFAFDNIFGPNDSQQFIFEQAAEPVIDGVLQGYNGTIFAYGQTGSGKTHTMEGPDGGREDHQHMGVIPRMMGALFQGMIKAPHSIEFQVKVSFLEIYMERIQDLLDPSRSNLMIKEDKQRGIYIKDCTEMYVDSVNQMMEVMRVGGRNRSIAQTRMNDRSSRSHSIFIVTVFQKDTSSDTVRLSKLYFVDLAGSEKVGKTNASGQQLEEAKMINKSLAALGNVINALTDKNSNYVPYRDSKLTRILQESLGGNAKTTLIICCSMNSYNARETLSTLRFGARAKNIKNKPVINQERSVKELEALLEKADQKIKNLTQTLTSASKFIESRFNQSIVREFQDIISKGMIIESQENKSEEKEESIETTTQKQQKPQKEREEVTLMLLRQHTKICQLEEDLYKVQQEKEELEFELSCRNQEIQEMSERIETTNSSQQMTTPESIEGLTITGMTEILEQEGLSTCETNIPEMDRSCQQPNFVQQGQQELVDNLEDSLQAMTQEQKIEELQSIVLSQKHAMQDQIKSNLKLQNQSERIIAEFNKFKQDSVQVAQKLENSNQKLQESVDILQKQLDQKVKNIEVERKEFAIELEMKDQQIYQLQTMLETEKLKVQPTQNKPNVNLSNLEIRLREMNTERAQVRFLKAYSKQNLSPLKLVSYEPGRYVAPQRRFASPYMINSSYINPSDPNSMRNLGHLRYDPFYEIPEEKWYTPKNANISLNSTEVQIQKRVSPKQAKQQFYQNLNLGYAFGGKTNIKNAFKHNQESKNSKRKDKENYNYEENLSSQNNQFQVDQNSQNPFRSISSKQKSEKQLNKTVNEDFYQGNVLQPIKVSIKKNKKASKSNQSSKCLEQQKQRFEKLQKNQQEEIVGTQEIMKMIDRTRKENKQVFQSIENQTKFKKQRNHHKRSSSCLLKQLQEVISKFQKVKKSDIDLQMVNKSDQPKIELGLSNKYSSKSNRKLNIQTNENFSNNSQPSFKSQSVKQRRLIIRNQDSPMSFYTPQNQNNKSILDKQNFEVSPLNNSFTIDQMISMRQKVSSKSLRKKQSISSKSIVSKQQTKHSTNKVQDEDQKSMINIQNLLNQVNSTEDISTIMEKINIVIKENENKQEQKQIEEKQQIQKDVQIQKEKEEDAKYFITTRTKDHDVKSIASQSSDNFNNLSLKLIKQICGLLQEQLIVSYQFRKERN